MRDAVVTCAVLAAVTIFTQPCQAQNAPSSDPDEARIEDVITASHIRPTKEYWTASATSARAR